MGCPAYVAPEVLKSPTYDGKPADMWSTGGFLSVINPAGVLLYVLLYGHYPFYDNDMQKLFKKIREGDVHVPTHVSLDARILMYNLLRVNPLKRPSAIRILRTAWMQPGAVKKMLELQPQPVTDNDQHVPS